MTQKTERNNSCEHHFLTQFIQKLSITISLFIKNDLFTHAASASFAFLLSLTPIILMILVVIVRVLNRSPETIHELADFFPQLQQYINIESFSEKVLLIRKIGIFELIIGFGIFWAARKLFYSVQIGLSTIYRSQTSHTVLFKNLVPVLCELLIAVLYAICIVIISTAKTVFSSTVFSSILPSSILRNSITAAQILPLIMLSIFCFVSYKTIPRIRTKNRNAASSAIFCTLSFFLIQIFFSKFVNISKYNMMYGFLSNLIIMMLLVYIFFQLFLFFAQFNFVQHYFDILLLSRIYLLPNEDDSSLQSLFLRLLYIKPYQLFSKYAYQYKAGQIVFNLNDKPEFVFYVYSGSVEETGKQDSKLHVCGQLFGETDFVLRRPRETNARSTTESTLLKIPVTLFDQMLSTEVKASLKTGKMLKEYIQSRECANSSTEIPTDSNYSCSNS